MNLRVIESIARDEIVRSIPELFVSLVDPADDGGNVTSALGEIRLWLVPPLYSTDGPTRTLELIVRVGNPLIRNSGRFKGGLDYVDEVIAALNGHDYNAGNTWQVQSARYWKQVGTIHWYEIRFSSTEEV